MALMRTAKSCGSDAPGPASSLREEAQATVSNKPGHRGEREVSRKTIARGMPGDFRCDRGDYARVLFYFAREASVTGLEESIPFCVIHSPGTCFCPGSAQGRRLMGFMRGTGRPICGKRDDIVVGCVDNSRDGLPGPSSRRRDFASGRAWCGGPPENRFVLR